MRNGDRKHDMCKEKQRGWGEQGVFQQLCLVLPGAEEQGRSPLRKGLQPTTVSPLVEGFMAAGEGLLAGPYLSFTG